eukprot:gene4312-biopygen3500
MTISKIHSEANLQTRGKQKKTMYNGDKRVHALKYQAVVAANGLIANLYGTIERKRHDARLLRVSGIIELLEVHSNRLEGTPVCIYGDPAYPLRPHLQVPFKNNASTAEQPAYNEGMYKVRVSVEWVFDEMLARCIKPVPFSIMQGPVYRDHL